MREILIAGSSMSPTLQIGDVVRVDEMARVRCGDVFVFQTSGEPICHRAVCVIPWRRERVFLHRGDARGNALGVVSEALVIGRVDSVRTATGEERVVEARRFPVRDLLGGGLWRLRSLAAERVA